MNEKLPKGWSAAHLASIALVTSGGTPARSQAIYWNGDIPWVTTGEVSFNIITTTNECITEIGLANSAAKIFPAETLLIALYGQGKTRGTVAKLGISAATNQACAAIIFNSQHNQSFYFYYFQNKYNELRELSNSGSQKNLSLDLLKSLLICSPPLAEQQKIAHILTTWDAAITCTQRLLENSKQQKNALMQQLLTGRRRLPSFNGEWREQSIQSFSQNSSKKNIRCEQLPVLSCSKHYGFIDSLEYFKKKVFSNDLSTYKIICRGEFGYPANHIEEGAIGYQNKYSRALVSPIYIVFKLNKQVDANFVYSILKTDSYRQKFSTATSASVDRRGSLRWSEFSKIKILLPPLDEQKAIAKILTAADALIAQYEVKLAHLQMQKKALMQQLLTGKIRVMPDTLGNAGATPA